MLTSLLSLTPGPVSSAVQYAIGGQALSAADFAAATHILADDTMRLRLGDASDVLTSWRDKRDGGPDHTPLRRRTIEVYARIGFGLPGKPSHKDHLEGHVAELLWHRLMTERTVCSGGRQLAYIPPLKADTTEPGGDGLAVYRIGNGTLVFRLWEIKKHDSSARISATIRRASEQLKLRGEEYLAKLAAPETVADDEVAELFKEVVELWLDGNDRGGVGVSVGTSAAHAPSGPNTFGSILTAFPHYSAPGQTESIVVAVPDFPAFAIRVREIVWSGL
ncbi:hypothetical protein [Allorhizocola rhizosphaerae]|uniref:hypothetical protein n=1 Tax=Allorhizocola rhizosphaerae TaxID=1872709 RepID=UPI001B8CEEBE|nr:hypothetical protein [Allorhizocola rhizosphaerae]